MTRTRLVRATLARVALACAALACVPSRAPAAEAEGSGGIMIGTGAVTGIYYRVGNAICRLVERDKRAAEPGRAAEPVLPCGAMMTEGSAVNVAGLRAGTLDAALVQSDVLAHAVHGTGSFRGRANGRLRTLFSLHGEPFQLLVPRGLGLDGFADLRGRKISTGPNGSVLNEVFAALMRRHDLTEASFAQVLHLPTSDQVQAFCEGDVEAVGMLVGAPFAPFRHAIDHCGGDLLSVDSQADRALVADTAAYTPIVIPRGTYPGIERDIATFGVVAVAVTTAEMPEAVVYRMVRAVFERLDDLRAMHPSLVALDPRRMVTDGLTAPLHPGALRYFREKGLL
ncbi:TAXI family TRAP transporter solute-binding subunit [Methylobacterium sp. NEAU 140]|uniref:TAXI family TRAP transporter solute-binding subunit n=1 Tax=Methylobacterium sp. NEAU 140 TaxID=3064945 RepID=UPI002735DB8D|nr:TAXI family TRAP transporter solute-binding subunit [Methylobacterium sp. NEAU 140]MDP4021890.1 TAXI family TRAP transporter solute-binding subunit [Methylobacterium sp. NEAU 140]